MSGLGLHPVEGCKENSIEITLLPLSLIRTPISPRMATLRTTIREASRLARSNVETRFPEFLDPVGEKLLRESYELSELGHKALCPFARQFSPRPSGVQLVVLASGR